VQVYDDCDSALPVPMSPSKRNIEVPQHAGLMRRKTQQSGHQCFSVMEQRQTLLKYNGAWYTWIPTCHSKRDLATVSSFAPHCFYWSVLLRRLPPWLLNWFWVTFTSVNVFRVWINPFCYSMHKALPACMWTRVFSLGPSPASPEGVSGILGNRHVHNPETQRWPSVFIHEPRLRCW
jgi:hypothetical protein